MADMMRIVVLVSGDGSNLQALMNATQSGYVQADITAVISNRPDVRALERARLAKIKTFLVDHTAYATREAFEQALVAVLQPLAPDLILLAGFMRILTPLFIARFSGQILNIHPSLLPVYKGLNTHERVLQAGDLFHGCSVHFVTPELDSGAVIAQSMLMVRRDDTLDTLRARVVVHEHSLYPRIVSWITAGRVALLGKQVYLDGQLLAQPIRFFPAE